MGENYVKCKLDSFLIIFTLVLSGILLVVPMTPMILPCEAASAWVESSMNDFKDGTLNNVELEGTGSTAELRLKGNSSGTWTLKPKGSIPDSRRGHVLASIHGTDKVLLFGGYKSGKYYDDTWVYDLSDNMWTEMKPLNKPGGRHSHAMATIYDTYKVLLFGGYKTSSSANNETWVYDFSANTWTNKNPSGNKPSARAYHAMASVYNDDKVVLFSGFNGTVYENDTWVYDLNLNSWSKKSTSSPPTGSKGHEMANLYKTKDMVLFGGNDGSKDLNETWIYNLTTNTWTNKNPMGSKPSARRGHGMAQMYGTKKVMLFGPDDQTWVYDASSNTWSKKSPLPKPRGRYISHGIAPIYGKDKALLFSGGYDSGGWIHLGDTWVFDLSATSWTNKTSSMKTKPSARRGHVLASIHGIDKVIMYGGWNGSYLADTWVYDLSDDTWTEMIPSTKPAGRYSHAMATIYGTDKVIMFGGYKSAGVNSETWVYDLSANIWTNKNPTGSKPSAREYHAMASVHGDDKVVLFGGYNGSGYETDTWIYDFSANQWAEKSPTTSPSGRKGHEMANVYGTVEIVLFGGNESGNKEVDDTWIYNLTADTWTKQTPSRKPSARRGHGTAAIHGIDKVLLFGGPDNQTWLYDLSANTWTKKSPATKPTARYITHGIATIYGTNKAVLFGGGGSGGDLDDTWVYDALTYPKNGTYVSSAFDTGGNTTYNSIKWTFTTPTGTSIKFQLRTAASKSGLSSNNFVGPNGSISKYYTTSPFNTWTGHNGDQWVQYKAYLSTTNVAVTPILTEVNISYNNKPQTMLFSPPNGDAIPDNTPTFTWKFADLDSGKQSAFQVLIDDDIDFTNIDIDSGEQISANQYWIFPTGMADGLYTELPDGSWYWMVRTKDVDGSWGQYTDPFVFTVDTHSPTSQVTLPAKYTFYNSLPIITGTAMEHIDGTGVDKVEISINRESDDKYWDGFDWSSGEVWLLVTGTTEWTYDSSLIDWTSGQSYIVSSRAYDLATNIEVEVKENKFGIDSDNPVSSVDYPADGSYINELKTISGSAIDTGGAGIDSIEVCIKQTTDNKYWSGSKWITSEDWLAALGTTSWTFDTSSIPLSTNTKYQIKSRATDSANNIETAGKGIIFTFDSEQPKTIIQSPVDNSFLNNLEVISGVVEDTNGAGISEIEINIHHDADDHYWDGIDWSSVSSWLTATIEDNSWEYDASNIVWTTDSYYTIQSRGIDVAGNIEESNPGISFMFDNEPPHKLDIVVNDGTAYTNSQLVLLTLNSEDSGSGTAEMAFKTGSSSWSTWEEFSNSKSIQLSNGDGKKTIYCKVKDEAGNTLESSSEVVLDTIPPYSLHISINDGALETESTSVDLNLNAHDALSGVHQMSLSTDGKTWTPWETFVETKAFELPSGDGEKTVYFKVKDRAGNIAEPVMATILKVTDSDKDGVPDYRDAFPDDIAASVDSDGDNYPDAWNDGMSEKDSTTGLELDYFPNDPGSYKPTQDTSKPGSTFITPLVYIIVIIVIAIIVALGTTMVIRNKHQRIGKPYIDDKILKEMRDEVIYGTAPKNYEIPDEDIQARLEERFNHGEITEETYQEMKKYN